jgi:hypothetical protein
MTSQCQAVGLIGLAREIKDAQYCRNKAISNQVIASCDVLHGTASARAWPGLLDWKSPILANRSQLLSFGTGAKQQLPNRGYHL